MESLSIYGTPISFPAPSGRISFWDSFNQLDPAHLGLTFPPGTEPACGLTGTSPTAL